MPSNNRIADGVVESSNLFDSLQLFFQKIMEKAQLRNAN